MNNAHNTNDQDTVHGERPIDARRAEQDAKRDMLDADKQDAYDAAYEAKAHTRHGATCLFSLLALANGTNCDEQETTED